LPPPPPDEEARLRDDAEEERRREALLLPLALFALARERGLLFEALRLFAPLPLFDALERVLRELALEPFALRELRFCLLDERAFACAITPPWAFDSFKLANRIPR
jgi:hypothetical protein